MRFVLTILILLLPIAVFSEDDYEPNYNIATVETLSKACKHVVSGEENKEYDQKAYGLCLGYFRGIVDTYQIQRLYNKKGKICPPQNVTWLHYIKAFLKWSEHQTAPKEINAWTGVITSLSEEFPCKLE